MSDNPARFVMPVFNDALIYPVLAPPNKYQDNKEGEHMKIESTPISDEEDLDKSKADLLKLIIRGGDDPFKDVLMAKVRQMQKDLDRRHITMTTEQYLNSMDDSNPE